MIYARIKDEISTPYRGSKYNKMISYLKGNSEKITNVTNLIFKIADTQTNILIFGESGTGKELAARMIHINSSRNSEPFIDLNCAALPDSLLETELFGIEKGVATGVDKRTGKIEQSDGGTLFLDEIGDMSLTAQAKLLRALQEKKIMRLGGKDNIEVDLRIVAATNKDLLEEIKKGNFREDLYYRLNEVSIKMPSLRDIKEDIQALAEYFFDIFKDDIKNIQPKGFDQKSIEYLRNYDWPGNVRELKNEIKRASIVASGNEITNNDLSQTIRDFIVTNNDTFEISETGDKTLKELVEDLEIKVILDKLEETKGNKLRASNKLGITRQGLLKKIKRYGLEEAAQTNRVKSISDHIIETEKGAFIGRESTVNLINKIIVSKNLDYYVLFIHGLSGIGKTHLVKEIIRQIDSEIISFNFDCREIEPTERGFLSQFSKKLDLNPDQGVDGIIQKLKGFNKRVVLVLDTFENFGLLETWLRKSFIPSLPDNVITIIVGRQPPNSAWFTNEEGLGVFFKEIELGELSYNEVLRFLKAKGLTKDQSEKVYTIVHGHPLALEMASRSIKKNPNIELTYLNFPELIQSLTHDFIDGLTPTMKNTLESVSVLRRFDDPFLRFMLSDDFEEEIIYELANLPFTTITSEGYLMHDIVRETLSKNLRFTDPEKYKKFKRNAWLYLIKKAQVKDREELWKSTADLLYLIENPAVRDAFFPRGFINLTVEMAEDKDEKTIMKLAKQNEPAEGARIIKYWWENYPYSFKVVKNLINEIEGFFIFSEIGELDHRVLNEDPVAKTWYKHLDDNPIGKNEKVLFLRRWLSKGFGEMPCTPQAASWLDVKRNYMELRPNLKRMYMTVNDLETYAPIAIPLGFKILEKGECIIGDLKYHTAIMDFGPESIDGWLRRLIGIELGIESLEVN
jgi:DNA-binding NtrC family response regulator